jgi:hypothetical protein
MSHWQESHKIISERLIPVYHGKTELLLPNGAKRTILEPGDSLELHLIFPRSKQRL